MAVVCCVQAKDLVPTPMSQLEPTLVNNATLAAASSALASVARGPHVSPGFAVAAILAARFASRPPALHMCSCLPASLIPSCISVLGLRPGGHHR